MGCIEGWHFIHEESVLYLIAEGLFVIVEADWREFLFQERMWIAHQMMEELHCILQQLAMSPCICRSLTHWFHTKQMVSSVVVKYSDSSKWTWKIWKGTHHCIMQQKLEISHKLKHCWRSGNSKLDWCISARSRCASNEFRRRNCCPCCSQNRSITNFEGVGEVWSKHETKNHYRTEDAIPLRLVSAEHYISVTILVRLGTKERQIIW